MLFHTGTFLVFFLVFLSFYFSTKEKTARVTVLLIFSNVFYGWWDWRFLALLWATIFVDFFVALAIAKSNSPSHRRALLFASLFANLGLLSVFKYYNFFISSLAPLGLNASFWHLENLILPVGLSFYTFQSISYTIDVYRGKQKPIPSLLDYAAFVCYFPQMVAGPIERASHLSPQILAPISPTRERIAMGLFLFSIGFLKKSMADTFAILINPTFSDLKSALPAEAVASVFGFGIQIYLDFSGYTDMARGVSKIMGVDLMINFRTPYLSTSIKDFWHRWHISLSLWLRDYLYISLGGNRKGIARQLCNLLLTMALGGLWHGAGFNFILWGIIHGSLLCLQSIFDICTEKFKDYTEKIQPLGKIFGWGFTFLAVNYTWIYFRCPTYEEASFMNEKILTWLASPSLPVIYPGIIQLIIAVIAIEAGTRWLEDHYLGNKITLPLLQEALQEDSHIRAVVLGLASGLMIFSGLILLIGVPTQQFIYFQF